MPKTLQVDRAVDKHLKPVKDSDGTLTALELSTDTVKVKNLDIAGNISSPLVSTGNLMIDAGGDITLDSGGDVTLDPAGHYIFLKYNGGDASKIYTSSTQTKLMGAANHHSIEIESTGTGNVILDSNGDIDISSNDGNFIMRKGATEFSATNSAYAGMILGYTDIGLNEAHAAYNLTTAYEVPTDEFSVAFKAPPSGNVEIFMQIWFSAGSTGQGDLFAGLSTANATSGYAVLQNYHEEVLIDQSGRYGIEVTSNIWTLTGLTAGTAYEYWVGFKSTSTGGTPYLAWGGNSTGRYSDFIMKATALPATITT